MGEVVFNGYSRIDTLSAPKMQEELEKATADGFEKLVIDMKDTEYISSAGLRVLLMFQKKSAAQSASMVLRNVSEDVKEIFDVTGFTDFLTIE